MPTSYHSRKRPGCGLGAFLLRRTPSLGDGAPCSGASGGRSCGPALRRLPPPGPPLRAPPAPCSPPPGVCAGANKVGRMGSPRRWRGSAVACPRPRRGRTRAAPGRSRLPLPPPCRASAHTGGRGPAFPPRRPLGRSSGAVLRRPRLRRVGAPACSAPGLSRCLVLLPLALPPAALSPSPSRPPPPPGAGERKRLTPAAAGTGGARLSQRTKKASPPVALTTCEKAQKAYFVQLSIYLQNLLPFDNAHSESGARNGWFRCRRNDSDLSGSAGLRNSAFRTHKTGGFRPS